MRRAILTVAVLLLVFGAQALAQQPPPSVSLPLIADGRPTRTATIGPSATLAPTNTATVTATRTPTNTPTNTATATVTPIPDIPLPNGGFEAGREPWTFSTSAQRTEGNAHTGSWSAGISSIFGATVGQDVSVPVTHPYLSYWQKRQSFSSSCDVEGRIIVAGVAVQSWTFCTSQQVQTWTRHTVDLSAYAGQTVSVVFTIAQSNNVDPDDVDLDAWSLDDVAWSATP